MKRKKFNLTTTDVESVVRETLTIVNQAFGYGVDESDRQKIIRVINSEGRLKFKGPKC